MTAPSITVARPVFVQTAAAVSCTAASIALIDLAPATVVVSPGGTVGFLTTGLFLDQWYEGESGTGTRSVPAVLSLLDPDRVAGADTRFTLSLPRIHGTGLVYEITQAAGRLPASAGACVLFIDPVTAPRTPATTPADGAIPEIPPDRWSRAEAMQGTVGVTRR